MPAQPAHRVRRKPGFFHPVQVRARSDGWSVLRQCLFLAQLYLTGSVTAASRAVGMTPKSAYRLRQREGAESFAHAWDRILTHPGKGRSQETRPDWRKVTNPTLRHRVETGLVKPVLHHGRVVAIAKKPDNTALLRLVRRIDTQTAGADRSLRGTLGGVSQNMPVGVTPRRSGQHPTVLDR